MTGLSGEKKNLVARARLFVRQVMVELRRVVWPTRKQVTTYTGVVLVFVTGLSLIVAVLDFVFGKGILAIFG
jgi:preprotein translocase subunit SecE